MEEYKIIIHNNTYVSLYYGSKSIYCYDNDLWNGEEIMESIEQRTKMDFYDIPVEMKRNFDGFRFLGLSGYHSFYSDEVRSLKKQQKGR